jgi:RNA-directed DNA polymerase
MLAKIKNLKELAMYLGVTQKQLAQINVDSQFITFQIPKPGKTEKRTIEAPTGNLKYLLDRLSDGLQWLYSEHRTKAAQGYIRSVKNDPDKRTIFTNAKRHLGKKYLLNVDLDNFFHQVTEKKVHEIFAHSQLFSFDTETENYLTKFVCFKGRLPMGSPTSPPLSNFATIDMDNELTLWTKHQRINYTRFVDDLSFSSDKPISAAHFKVIDDILLAHQFKADPGKIKWYGPNDCKEVTGLIVGNKITVSAGYLAALEAEIQKLKEIRAYAMNYPDFSVLEWIQKLEQVVGGRLAFVKLVYGGESAEYRNLLTKMNQQFNDVLMQSMSWRYSGYEFFT